MVEAMGLTPTSAPFARLHTCRIGCADAGGRPAVGRGHIRHRWPHASTLHPIGPKSDVETRGHITREFGICLWPIVIWRERPASKFPGAQRSATRSRRQYFPAPSPPRHHLPIGVASAASTTSPSAAPQFIASVVTWVIGESSRAPPAAARSWHEAGPPGHLRAPNKMISRPAVPCGG